MLHGLSQVSVSIIRGTSQTSRPPNHKVRSVRRITIQGKSSIDRKHGVHAATRQVSVTLETYSLKESGEQKRKGQRV